MDVLGNPTVVPLTPVGKVLYNPLRLVIEAFVAMPPVEEVEIVPPLLIKA